MATAQIERVILDWKDKHDLGDGPIRRMLVSCLKLFTSGKTIYLQQTSLSPLQELIWRLVHVEKGYDPQSVRAEIVQALERHSLCHFQEKLDQLARDIHRKALELQQVLDPYGCSLSDFIKNKCFLPPGAVPIDEFQLRLSDFRKQADSATLHIENLKMQPWTPAHSAIIASEEKKVYDLMMQRLCFVLTHHPINPHEFHCKMRPMLAAYMFQLEEYSLLRMRMMGLKEKKLFSPIHHEHKCNAWHCPT
jgi:hypothetical protein